MSTPNKTSLLTPIADLDYGCFDAEAEHYDWSSGFGEDWESFEAVDMDCPECDFHDPVTVQGGETECPDCGHFEQASSDGPMMSYYYPLTGTHEADDALLLEHLPLCLVRFEDVAGGIAEDDRPEWALALTGGGMDLSWQIAEAHQRLGYLPPAHACALPGMAGKDLTSPVNRWVIDGCMATGAALASRGNRIVEDMVRLINSTVEGG